MKNLTAKYGRHFWVLTLPITIYAWCNFASSDYPLDAICFSAFSCYFFLRGTGKITDANDPFVAGCKKKNED